MRTPRHLVPIFLVAAMVGAAACSSDSSSGSTSAPPATSAAATTDATTDATTEGTSTPVTTAVPETTASTEAETTSVETTDVETTVVDDSTVDSTDESAPVSTEPAGDDVLAGMQNVVETLASDELNGRNNLTPDSDAAQEFLITQLAEFAQPLTPGATGSAAYRQIFAEGTNLVGMIPGSDLADQYVLVGAHYDHLGNDCRGNGTDDHICNGATDNATGTAVALAIARAIATDPVPPRRSVIIALWDAEEDGLLGSQAYVANPLVPLAQTIAYVNFDIQGTNISPALRDVTVMVGTETGGPNLVDAALAAADGSPLQTVPLSLLFGQGRSDHATFVGAGVPSVFFTDATPPCYHTVGDDASIVDYPKLDEQEITAEALVRDLADTDDVPTFNGTAPPATYDDAVALNEIIVQAQPDFVRFSDADRAVADKFVTDLGAIVAAGADAFDDAAVGTLLGGAVAIVSAWSNGECDGFLEST